MGFNKQDGYGPSWRRGYDGEVVRKIVVEKGVDLKELLDEMRKKNPQVSGQPIHASNFETLGVDKVVFDVINEFIFVNWNGISVRVSLDEVVKTYNQRKFDTALKIEVRNVLDVWPLIKKKYSYVGWHVCEAHDWNTGNKTAVFSPARPVRDIK